MAEPRVPILFLVPAAIVAIAAVVFIFPRLTRSGRRELRHEARLERDLQAIADRCEGGDGAACGELADRTPIRDAFGKPDYAKVDALRRRACELGHVSSCPRSEREAAKTPPAPITCECADGPACAEAATSLEQTLPPSSRRGERARAIAQLRACADAACARGPGAACARGSVAIQQAIGKDAAYAYFQKACALGDGWACYREYVDHWDGDADGWFSTLTAMCEKGTAVACMSLGAEYRAGGMGRKDAKLAARYKKRACTLAPGICDAVPALPR
jgi:hypothetical protein